MRVRFVAWALAALVFVTPVVAAKGIEAQRGPALDFLADQLVHAGGLAANIAEAAHANGLDLAAWPSPNASVAQAIPEPPLDAENISLLRPLRALALAGDARAGPDGSLTKRVLSKFGPEGYGDARTLNDDAYAILALRAARFPEHDGLIQSARAHLLLHQNPDGGWGWIVGGASGTDLTGLVVEALDFSGGVPTDGARDAAAFLAGAQAERGFAEAADGTPNCESTVWGLRATDRLGGTPRDADWWFLLGLQRADGGFAHLPGGASDLLCTSEAAALLGEAHAGAIAGPALGPADAPMPAAVAIVAIVGALLMFRVRRP